MTGRTEGQEFTDALDAGQQDYLQHVFHLDLARIRALPVVSAADLARLGQGLRLDALDVDANGRLNTGFEVNTGNEAAPVVLDFDDFLIGFRLGGEIALDGVTLNEVGA